MVTKVEALRACEDQSENGLFKFILYEIDGYGADYVHDPEKDAEDLSDWVEALRIYKQSCIEVEHERARALFIASSPAIANRWAALDLQVNTDLQEWAEFLQTGVSNGEDD